MASLLGSLVKGKTTEEKDGEKPKEDDEREHRGKDQEPGIDFGISFVQDDQIETLAIGNDNDAGISFVQDDQIETLVIGNNDDAGSDTADHTELKADTFKLEKHEKKEHHKTLSRSIESWSRASQANIQSKKNVKQNSEEGTVRECSELHDQEISDESYVKGQMQVVVKKRRNTPSCSQYNFFMWDKQILDRSPDGSGERSDATLAIQREDK